MLVLPLNKKPEDLAAYIKFRKALSLESAWVNPTTPEALSNIIKMGKFNIFVAKDNSKTDIILGTIILEFKSDSLKIALIAVLNSARSKGIGKALMLFASKIASANNKKEIQLTVNASNISDIGFYESMGYKQYTETNSWLRVMKKSDF